MKAKKRRAQVMTCAIEEFADKGYHKTSVDDIVTRAGIARGTFYVYFKDKRSIFDELLDRFIQEIDAQIIRLDPDQGPQECLKMMRQNFRGILQVCLEQQLLTKILLSDAVGLDPDFDRKLLDFYQKITQLLEASLTLGQEMGVVRDCNGRLVALCILGSLKEVMYQVTMRGLEADADKLADDLLALYRDGVFELG